MKFLGPFFQKRGYIKKEEMVEIERIRGKALKGICDEERKIKKMIEEKKNYSNTFYKNVQQIAGTLEIEIDKVTGKKKSTWKKEVHD